MYIGRDVDAISNVEKLDNITFDGGTTYALEKSSVAYTPSGANNILISVDGVMQYGNFTVSGTNIVFTGWSPTSSNTCDFILHIGVGLISTPADSSVTASKLGSLAVTGAKLNTDVISAQTALAAEPADTDEFMVSDAGVLKRIDYSLIKAANTPSFFAYLSADQALSDSTETKIEIDTEIYDTDSDYDNTTNYRFTPTTAGKYVIFGSVNIFQDVSSDLKIAQILWYKNGSKLYETHDNFTANYLRGVSQSMSVVMDMNGSSDYVEMYAEIQTAASSSNLRVESANRRTVFGAYKLIGV